MNPGRYFMPNMAITPVMMRNAYMIPRGMGLFSRLANGIRSFNWSRLLSGANRTLNVMNQTIPLIRQAKPMMNNMKSMLQLAKAFRNETGVNNNISNNIKTHHTINKQTNNIIKKDSINDEFPTFFI